MESEKTSLIQQAESLLVLLDLKRLQAKAAKEASAAYAEAVEAMVTRLADEGMQNVKLSTGECIALSRSAYFKRAGDSTTEDICEVMKACGLADLVKETFNANTLKAYVQELHDQAEDPVDDLVTLLPEQLQPLFISGQDQPTLSVTGRKTK